MKSKTYIITKDPLFIGLTSRLYPFYNFLYLGKLFEMREVFKATHMRCIIGIDFIKEQVAILKATRMNGDYQTSFLITFIVFTKESLSLSNTTHYDIRT